MSEKIKNHKKIGFSHGTIYRITDKYTGSSIDIFKKIGVDAIEICLHDVSEVERLPGIVKEAKDFSYKSIHFPTQNIVYKNDQQTKEILDKIEKFYFRIGANLALVHPDLVEDWEVFDQYKLNWAIENMDDRKEKYKTAEELAEFFKMKPDWKLVLDLNHCYTNDKTMELADVMIANLKDKIAEIHLSGYSELHDPLFKTKQNFIMDYCKGIDVPIIIESVFNDVNDVEKEYNYIREYLK